MKLLIVGKENVFNIMMISLSLFLGFIIWVFLHDGRAGVAPDSIGEEAALVASVNLTGKEYIESYDGSMDSSLDAPVLSSEITGEEEKFSLLAVFDTAFSELASAVIFHKEYGAFRYKIGDIIFDGMTVVDINRDFVILQKDDRRIVVDLIPLGSQSVGSNIGSISEVREEKPEQERNNVLVNFDLYPVSHEAPSGYIVGEDFPKNIMDQVDIRPGDVILSVNGYPVGQSASDELARRSFSATMTADVVIIRNGMSLNLNYPRDVKRPGRAIGSRR